jgi:hypothetical protein
MEETYYWQASHERSLHLAMVLGQYTLSSMDATLVTNQLEAWLGHGLVAPDSKVIDYNGCTIVS